MQRSSKRLTGSQRRVWLLLTVLALLINSVSAALAFVPAAETTPGTPVDQPVISADSPVATVDANVASIGDANAVGLVLSDAATPSGATIASEFPDYAPGATVNLFGKGWAIGEPVHIYVNDDAGQSWSHDSNPDPVADGSGSFTYSFALPSWFVATYSVTARGPVSGLATSSFTDLAIGTYDQCSNDFGHRLWPRAIPAAGGSTVTFRATTPFILKATPPFSVCG